MAQHDAEAFHFPERFDPVPGLFDQVEQLRGAGRERSALDLVLGTLRREGKSADAFECALLLCSGRTPASASGPAEPITDEQLTSPYLAPVATECASCQTHWYSGHTLMAGHRMSISNPIGLQCQVCRYTLCRNCLPRRKRNCPERGCRGTLTTPVLPTGRPRRQPANQHTEPVEYVLILWSGVRPEPAEIDELLALACTWQDFSGARITTAEHAEAGQGVGEAFVYREESEGRLGAGALGRLRSVLIEYPRSGRRRVFVVAAPG